MGRQSCLRPGCGGAVYARGICHRCYRVVHELVQDGRTTWAVLARVGRVLPSVNEHRKYREVKGTITRWFLEGKRSPYRKGGPKR